MARFVLEPVVRIASAPGAPEVLYHEMLARPEVPSVAEFVRRISDLGASSYLDECMLQEALDLASESGLIIGCNIARQSLRSWEAILRRIGRSRSASSLVIEITESGPDGANEAQWLALLSRGAKALGCRIAIDDAGCGAHAEEGLMRTLSIEPDIVKIDRTVIAQPEKLCALARLAFSAGAIAVAEGVESDRDLQIAIGAGIQYAQGWMFSKPESRRKKLA